MRKSGAEPAQREGNARAQTHGAWRVAQLCKHIYPDARHRDEASRRCYRALRKMVLPRGMCRSSRDKAMSSASMADAIWRVHCVTPIWAGDATHRLTLRRGRTFPHHIEIAENKLIDVCDYRDALPLGKIEIERTAMTATTIAAIKISV